MANLLDRMKQVQTERAQMPALGQTSRLQSMLSTKATGKAEQSRGPRLSDAAERVAAAEQQALASQQQAAGDQAVRAQDIQRSGSEQQFAQQTAQLNQQQQNQLAQANRQALEIANNLKRADLNRASDKELLDLANLGQMQALQDRRYMDSLRLEGSQRRLEDDLRFKEELQRSIFSEQESLFKDNVAFNEMMDMDDDTFAREIAQMDINFAWDTVRNDMKAANDRALYEGLSGLVSSGIGAYGAFGGSGGASLTEAESAQLKQKYPTTAPRYTSTGKIGGPT
jgi:hypothetical protein